jgi:NADP-dependent 3-hydroxy acid dehydrogenase YdfG
VYKKVLTTGAIVTRSSELFAYTVENHGGLDILMNSAGILNEESSTWRKMVDTNVVTVLVYLYG